MYQFIYGYVVYINLPLLTSAGEFPIRPPAFVNRVRVGLYT